MSDMDLDRPVTGALGRFTRDLTREARAGRLEPVRCRDEEVARVIDILLRHGKNNPALVGPAGVGKTAIVEGLGAAPRWRRRSPRAPDHARSSRSTTSRFLAGSVYRGQYEERIRALVRETSADPDVVLFIDELHNLIGQGTGLGVAMDAANMLKPSLVRGDFRVIGATTNEEYDRWICGDPALERRFQRVLVRELTSEETMDVLRARLERLEQHHNVAITEEALRASVELTDLHMQDRRRPDRAIDVLDEACAHAQAVARYSPRTEAMIATPTRAVARRGRRATRARARRDGGRWTGDEDGFETIARDGLNALQRFGAEIEAIFTAPPPSASAPPRGARSRSARHRPGRGARGRRHRRFPCSTWSCAPSSSRMASWCAGSTWRG